MSDKSFCVQCKKGVSNDTKQCECGCRTFVFGNIKVNEEGKLTCACGSNEGLRHTCHTDYTDKAVDSYQCASCGAGIGIEYHRNAKDMMYWGD